MGHALLVVDENRNIRELCRRELAREGYRVLLARTCREARRILAYESVDVIVSDFGRSHRQFTALAEDADERGTRLIVHTADVYSVLESLSPGVSAWVEKTGDLRQLTRTIACTLRRHPVPTRKAGVSQEPIAWMGEARSWDSDGVD
jgi:DNA-binding NtrC family response regulator